MSQHAIVVVDEGGELDDVREVLYELGLDFASWAKDVVPDAERVPRQLLVATAGAAVTLGYRRAERVKGSTWIAVTCDDSRTQKNFLLREGFNYLVRRPVHPIAFRLLLQRALFRGEDMRRDGRVAVGYAITYRTGILSSKATLVDLSAGGCRLLTDQPLEPESVLTVQLPRELAGGTRLNIPGQVLRTRNAELEGGDPAELSVAVCFTGLNAECRSRLHSVLESLASEAPSTGTETEPPQEAEAQGPEVRAQRGSYAGKVYVFGGDSSVVGRDLSCSGMCIERQPGLAVGDTVRLALSGAVREEPVVVQGRIVRDAGEKGLGLEFTEVTEPRRLEALVRSLPQIESLADQAEGRLVLSRIVPTLHRIATTDVLDAVRRRG